MIQPSEIVTLLYGLVALVAFFWLVRGVVIPGLAWFTAGISVMCAAYIFTVVEGLAWQDLFDACEHTSYACAGVCFCIGLIQLIRAEPSPAKPAS